MMFHIGLLLIALSGEPPTDGEVLDRILAKHATSLGNLATWRNLQAVTYHLDIQEPDFHLQAVYRAVRSGKMRIDIFANGTHIFTEAFNGTSAWQWRSGDSQAKRITEEASAPLRRGIELPGHLFTLLDMVPQGHRLTYLGDVMRLGKTGHRLQLTLKDGHHKYYFLDGESGEIIAHSDHRAFHPDIDPTEVLIETRQEDFRMIQGLRKPFRTVNWDLTNDTWLGTTQILDIALAEEIADTYFHAQHLEALPFPTNP